MSRILDLQRLDEGGDEVGLNNELISSSSYLGCGCSSCSVSGCVSSVAL